MTRLMTIAASIALAASLIGCTEVTVVRSYPPNSKLYINDEFVGMTPAVFSTPHSRIGNEFRVRLEHEGYVPREDTLHTQTCAGRIVGGFFSLGISLLIKGPTCFPTRQFFWLAPLPDTGEDGGTHPPTVDDRLRRLDRMRDQGTLSPQEYEERHQELLKGP